MGCCKSKHKDLEQKQIRPGFDADSPIYKVPAVAAPAYGFLEIIPKVDPSAKKIKEGRLVFWDYNRARWVDSDVELYNDSTLVWNDASPGQKSCMSCLGCIQIKKYASFLLAGPFTARLHDRPQVPPSTNPDLLIAIPTAKESTRTYWFLTANEADLNSWMAGIVKTLPPPGEKPNLNMKDQQTEKEGCKKRLRRRKKRKSSREKRKKRVGGSPGRAGLGAGAVPYSPYPVGQQGYPTQQHGYGPPPPQAGHHYQPPPYYGGGDQYGAQRGNEQMMQGLAIGNMVDRGSASGSGQDDDYYDFSDDEYEYY